MVRTPKPRDVGAFQFPSSCFIIKRPTTTRDSSNNSIAIKSSKPHQKPVNMADPEKAPIAQEPKFKGSCACGRLTYEISEVPTEGATMLCHCVTCRKISGAPFQAFLHVHSKAITLFDQRDKLRFEGLPKDHMGGIKFLRLSGSGERAFCISCNSCLAMRYKHEPDLVGMTLGTVDEDSVKDEKVREYLTPDAHIFTTQNAWWHDIDKDGLPKYDRFRGTFEQDMADWEKREGKQG